MEFLENSLHHRQLQKWGEDNEFSGDLSKERKIIKFKPTHEAFRKLQEAYVEAQMHLSQSIEEGGKRLKQIEEDLRTEQAQFEKMCE